MSKNHADFSGKKHPRAKTVICVTTGKIFDTAKEGARYYNIKSRGSVTECCKGKGKSAGKLPDGTPLVWMYLEDYEKATEEEIINRINKANEVGKGKSHPRAKAVICITTRRIFYTATEGVVYYNCSNHIPECCKGKKNYCGKLPDGTPLVWRYIEIIEL